MTRATRQSLSAAAVLAMACGLAAGQTDRLDAEARRGAQPDRIQTGQASMSNSPLRATKVIGANAVNVNGESLGKTSDLIIEHEGRVAYGLLSHGGLMGLGNKLVAVPWSMYQHRTTDSDTLQCTLPLTEAQIEAAPSFNAEDWAIVRERTWLDKTYRALGVDPDWRVSDRGYREHWTQATEQRFKGKVVKVDRRSPGRGMSDALIVTVRDDNGAEHDVALGPAWFLDSQGRTISEGDTIDVRVREGTEGRVDPRFLAREGTIGSTRLDYYDRDERPFWEAWSQGTDVGDSAESRKYVRASNIIGADLRASDGEVAGSIEDLVIDDRSDRVRFAVVNYGGLLGVGETRTAVPWGLVRFDDEGRASLQTADKARVRSAPELGSADWARFGDPNFRAGFYTHYGVEEPWADRDDRLSPSQMLAGWGRDSDYNRNYAGGKSVSISGTVLSVQREKPRDGMSDGVCLTIQAPEGQRKIHLGPAWYLDHQRLPNAGDTVTVTGVMVEDGDPRDSYIIASEVTTPNGTMHLRDRDGSPRWNRGEKR